MKKLLDSEESTSTPVQSRKTVVAENASPEKLQLQVQSDLLDESLTKVRVQRTRSDGSKLAGKLLIGRESLTFLTGNDQVCFSHSYLVLVWYELTASLAYAIKDNKTLVSYHFDLEDTSIGLLHAMDEKVASVLGESNSKDGGRRSGGRSKSTPRDSSVRKEIVGKRWIVKMLGSDKNKFRCISFFSGSFVVLDVSRSVLRVFDWDSMSHLEKHKDKLGSPKGRITFDYLRAKTEDGSFNCNLFSVQMFVSAQSEFFAEFDAFKALKDKPKASIPSSYP